MLTTCAVVLAGVWATAALAAEPIPAQVVFNASGTYTIDESYQGGGGSCSTQNSGQLTWVANYDTKILDGELQATSGSLASGVGPGNLELTKSGICTQLDGGCTASLQTGGTPQLTVSGSDPVRLQVQSLTPQLSFSGCSGVDNLAFMGRDVYVLNQSVPDATTAIASIPASVLADHNNNTTIKVDSGSAPGHVPSSCAGIAPGTGNVSCTASLTWSGTVLVRVCGTADEKTWLPYCVGAQKKEAASEAKSLRKIVVGNSKVSGCRGLDRSAIAGCLLGQSLNNGIALGMAAADEKIANDPPDARYATVAAPHPLALRALRRLRRLAPALAHWGQTMAQAVGYENALTTALNRQSGAASALAQGQSGAPTSGEAQTSAIFADAQHAATLFGQAKARAHAADKQLGRLIHKRHPLRKLLALTGKTIVMLKAIGAGLPPATS